MKQSPRAFHRCLVALSLMLLAGSFNPAMADAQSDALKAMIANKAAIKAGRAKAQTCTRCHGRDGIHQLAVRAGWKDSDGQFALVKLRALRDGKVSHQVMSTVAAGLKDQDILQIALWLDAIAAKR
ncbi:MAG: cytochrome c [Granulosicoccus sp.]